MPYDELSCAKGQLRERDVGVGHEPVVHDGHLVGLHHE